MQIPSNLQKPNYGLDAPVVVLRFFSIGLLALMLGALCAVIPRKGVIHWPRSVAGPLMEVGCVFLAQSGVMIWASKVGKLRLRDRVFDSICLRGTERVLDVGCGHGLLLIGAAKRLSTGRAVGIDLWQKEYQAGNSRQAARRNVEIEKVCDRVELVDGDARKLPFPDNSFDVILSSWALHNIYEPAGRETAIREIVCVLKPGGRLAISDVRHTREYSKIMAEARMQDIYRAGPNFMCIIPTFTLTARKSATEAFSESRKL